MKISKGKIPWLHCIIGILVGIICVLLRPFSPNSFWSLSDIINCWGFWITSVCLLVYFAKGKKEAGINTFTYLMSMNVVYYIGLYLRIDIIYWKQLVFWGTASVVCIFLSRLVFLGKTDHKWAGVFNACYQSVLTIELISLVEVFAIWRTHFIQLLFDVLSIPVLLFLYNRTNKKRMFTLLSTAIIVLAFYVGLAIINSVFSGF